METTHPAVVLDDYADRFKNVTCTHDAVTITFQDLVDMNVAEEAWGTGDFLVIASNAGCAGEEYHQPYSVSEATYDRDYLTAILWASAVHMKDCTNRIHVEVGNHVSKDVRPRFGRRAPHPQVTDAPPSAVPTRTVAPTTAIQTVTGSYSAPFNFSSYSATATTAALEAAATIDFSYVNKSLIPPDFEAEQFLPSYPGLNHVTLACTNCTAVGEIELIAGGFTVDTSDLEEVKDFLEEGFLEFSVNGFSALMAFQLSLLPGFKLRQFNAGLPPVGIPGLSIVGILNLGPELRPAAPISVVLDSPVDLYFGLEFHNLSLELSAGFKPALVLSAGVDFAGTEVSGGIGAYLDLPMLNAQINHLSNMTVDCSPPQPGSNADIYGSLINVVPSYELGGGVLWSLDIDLPGSAKYSFGGPHNLFNYTKPLPTTCLAFDKQSALVSAADIPSATATGKSKSAAGRNAEANKLWFAGLLTTLVAALIAV
ncbi:hypothetical protein LTR97_009602 [Elasticomyces elasticus]|uniref:DUF7029 domain-containing protein n=1 Tax=Elasticomyces elasticus TaxID=574655 RepID=A0AAN7VVA3_9PEZI|nr:hypothetical protein LTR97_009602 [Elasticomyces elasticus]